MEVDSLVPVESFQPPENRRLRLRVHGSRLIAAGTVPNDRLALRAGRHPLEDLAQVLHGAAADLEPGRHGSSG
jgi:hypothetical protein